ncbi:MAG: hypothetical protein M9933_01685 [Chitinophagaceae bacterium]|nr:hypothetical protein [Chitinophagaceae bacterium]
MAKYAPPGTSENLTVELAAVKDYYMTSNNGSVQKMITKLSIVVLFIVAMAIVNFVNINIGTSSYRIKETGLRKVFG